MSASLDDPAIREIQKRRIIRYKCERSLIRFTQYTRPGYRAGWFHRRLAAELQRFLEDCVAQKSPRLIVQAPPRHGKSELVSRSFPGFALGKHPDLEIIGASYAMALAERMNRDVQRTIDSDRYSHVFPHTAIPARGKLNAQNKVRNNGLVEMLNGDGSYRAAGVGVGITGMGAHIGIIDDPVKDAREALSKITRDAVWEWYRSTFYTRIAPGGGILIVMTRWHEDDLAGRLIEASQSASDSGDEDADVFRVLNFPAIAEEDEMHRSEGDALHPERFPVGSLSKIRTTVGEYFWTALYQGRPTPLGGGVFKDEWWRFWGGEGDQALPQILLTAVYADTAMKTKESNDYSAFQLWGHGADGRIYLLDQVRGKWEAPELEVQATAFWNKHRAVVKGGPPPPIAMKVEDKSSGTGLIQTLQRRGGIPIVGVPRGTDKLVRAFAGAPHVEAGNVVLPRNAPWLSEYLAEMSSFAADMTHKHDDQFDPTMDAIQDLLIDGLDLYRNL